MSSAKSSTVQKSLQCQECGNVAVIWRKESKNHGTGHKKHMYCYRCQETTAHLELDQWMTKKEDIMSEKSALAERVEALEKRLETGVAVPDADAKSPKSVIAIAKENVLSDYHSDEISMKNLFRNTLDMGDFFYLLVTFLCFLACLVILIVRMVDSSRAIGYGRGYARAMLNNERDQNA